MSTSDAIAPFAAHNHTTPPQRLGQRYNATRFLPEAGNTVVCHLDVSDPAHGAVLEARRRMLALPGAERFLYTPAESLHMTVFEGVIETRRTPDAWPAEIDRAASVDTVTTSMLERLATFSPPPGFAVRVADVHPTGLVLQGATQGDEAQMRAWRAALADLFGYRHENHDTYRFHMTFAYPIDWLPTSLLSVWKTELRAIRAELAETAPVIPLVQPAFCQFADMTRFEELLVLTK